MLIRTGTLLTINRSANHTDNRAHALCFSLSADTTFSLFAIPAQVGWTRCDTSSPHNPDQNHSPRLRGISKGAGVHRLKGIKLMKGGGEEKGQRDKKKTWITENVGRKDVTAWLVHGCHAATARSWGYGPGLEFRCCEADLRSLHKARKWTHNMDVGCLPSCYISEPTQFGDIRSFRYAANDFPLWVRTQQIYPKLGYSIMKRETEDAKFSETLVDYRLRLKIVTSPTGNNFKIGRILNSWQGNPYWTSWTPRTKVISFFETSPRLLRDACRIPGEQNFQYEYSHIRHALTSQKWVSHFGKVRPIIRWWQLQQSHD